VSPPSLLPIIRLPQLLSLYSEPPAWKRLVTYPLDAEERVSLIKDIFEQDGPEMVRHLRGEDAQAFVDVIDKARSHNSAPEERVR